MTKATLTQDAIEATSREINQRFLAKAPITSALLDPKLLGAALGDPKTWATWTSIIKGAFGHKLTAAELDIFRSVSGNRQAPRRRVREFWAIVGRRSGKSRVAALIASYLAAFVDHSSRLSPGEVGTVLVLAASRAQAASVFNYIIAFFEASPILRRMIESSTSEEIRLTGNVAISVHTNNHRTVRGRTLVAAIFDEVGFWRDETTSLPDVETYRAVLPALATTNGMLIGISSPYAQRGLLFTKHQASFGRDDPEVLVVQAGTKMFNPTIDEHVIEQAHRDDPESALAEWDGMFRSDLSTFVDRVVVERCVEANVRERPYDRKYRYTGFVDPSGGVHDSMTLGIAHREGDAVVLDCIREVRPPFSPDDVVAEFVKLLQNYRIQTVTGDRYAGSWVSDAFRQAGVRYVASERTRSEIYLDALPSLMAGTAILLDDTRLVSQISTLERRTSRGGRDTIDHMRGASDDLCNAALGALTHVASARRAESQSAGPGQSYRPQPNLGYANMKTRMLKRGNTQSWKH